MARNQKVLKRIGRGLLIAVIVLLIVVEDVLRFAGLLVRKILPADFEEYLRSKSNAFAFGVVGIAAVVYVIIHAVEYDAFWAGFYWTGISLMIFSKVYTVSVLGYLCRVYSDRLLAVSWIERSWNLYLSAKQWLKSFQWYKTAHAFVLRIKEGMKAMIRRLRERFQGNSMFVLAWRIIRMRRRS